MRPLPRALLCVGCMHKHSLQERAPGIPCGAYAGCCTPSVTTMKRRSTLQGGEHLSGSDETGHLRVRLECEGWRLVRGRRTRCPHGGGTSTCLRLVARALLTSRALFIAPTLFITPTIARAYLYHEQNTCSTSARAGHVEQTGGPERKACGECGTEHIACRVDATMGRQGMVHAAGRSSAHQCEHAQPWIG